MLEDHFDSFVLSMQEVFDTMVGIRLKCCNVTVDFRKDQNIIMGAMVVGEKSNYLITVESDYESAGFIISNMTGSKPDELSVDELVDGIQEIVNMVAGSTKNKLEFSESEFVLSTTFAILGKDVSSFTNNGILKQTACFKAGNALIRFNLYNM